MAATKDTTLVLNRVIIARKGLHSWDKADPSAPFAATIELQGATGKIELNLSERLSRRIVEIVADEVVAAGRATAEAMVADALLIQPTAKALTSEVAA